MKEQTGCLHPGGLALTRRALALCAPAPGARVLDAGCGEGATVAFLRGAGFAAVGVDLNAPEATGQTGDIRRADAAALPFASGSFAAVFFECSLSKMADPAAALREAARVLSPGGRLAVSDLFAKGPPCNLSGLLGRVLPFAETRAAAESAGLRLEHFEEHPKALASFWGELVFREGPEEALRLLGDGGEALKAARASYFLAVFSHVEPSPLCAWANAITGTHTTAALAGWRLARLRESLARAKAKSPFYAQHLAAVRPRDIQSLQDLARLPFTGAQTLAEQGGRMLCTSQSEVGRVRTAPTSGSTAAPKRVWFTEGDMARTISFFAAGMRPLAAPGEVVAILMSDGRPSSIADLLRTGLAEYGAVGRIHGNVRDAGEAAAACEGAACLVGVPAEVLYLCRKAPHLRPKTVLLSADYIPPPLVAALEAEWGCRVFLHYGLTETCYGLAVQCATLQRQHLRAPDFIVEIVDPATGAPLPDGQEGEIVLTSLRSEALPLVRYRTGDIGSLVAGPCPCGCSLPGLGPVRGRAANLAQPVNIHRLDDCLFALPGLAGYRARRQNGGLALTLETCGPPVDEAALSAQLGVAVHVAYGPAPPFTGSAKRRIESEEELDG